MFTNISGLLLLRSGLLATDLVACIVLEEVGKDWHGITRPRPVHIFFFKLELSVACDDWLAS